MRAILALILLAAAVWLGVRLRVNVWEWTMPIRFHGDIDNGFRWGKVADRVGYLNVYEHVGRPERGRDYTDYAPLRLGVMSSWVQWLKSQGPLPEEREPTRAFHLPLLRFNMAIELLSAVAAFLLVWHVRRSAFEPGHRQFALELATLAALLVWFNPASILESHGWPQWDVWVVPFFLFALYCGLRRWWLAAGLIIGLGALLKGQTLAVSWTIPLWALCVGDWRGAIRFIIGACTSIMLVGSPWALGSYDAATKLRSLHTPAIGMTILAALAAALLPRRFSPTLICFVLAASLYTSMRWLGGNDYWLISSFEVGTWQHQAMTMGAVSNLPGVLKVRYGWNNLNELLFTLPAVLYKDSTGIEGWRLGGEITMRTLMGSIFVGLSVLCAVRAAFLDRRRDQRVLLALSLPWLVFFLIPCQVHERYLLFASMAAGTWVVGGGGVTLLGLLLTGGAFVHVLLTMILARRRSPLEPDVLEWLRFLQRLLEPTYPGIAWLLLLVMLVLLYNIFTRAPARTSENGEGMPQGTESAG